MRKYGTFWHYTGVHGVVGIIHSEQMWASALEHLHDKTELKFGWGQLEKVWKDLRLRIDVTVRNPMDELFAVGVSTQELDSVFVLSTSSVKNSSYMWKNYAKSAGFCIAINAGISSYWAAQHAIKPSPSGAPKTDMGLVSAGWWEVLYTESEQSDLAKRTLNWVASNWLGMVSAQLNSAAGAQTLLPKQVLLTSALRIKPTDFASECEVRFIGARPASVDWLVSPEGRKYIPIVSKASATEAGDHQTWISMSEIAHSPEASQECIQKVKSELAEKGYHHVVVGSSTDSGAERRSFT